MQIIMDGSYSDSAPSEKLAVTDLAHYARHVIVCVYVGLQETTVPRLHPVGLSFVRSLYTSFY